MSQRFSDAELAAEYWRHNGDADLCSEGIRYGAYGRELESEEVENERLATLHRFATLPHAHEEPGAYAFQCKECDMRLQTDNQHQCEIFARNHQYLAHDYYKDKP